MQTLNKFNIGDVVYFLHQNQLQKAKILSVDILIWSYFGKTRQTISYSNSYLGETSGTGYGWQILSEDKYFSSKDEYKKSMG